MPMTYTYHLNYICIPDFGPDVGMPSELDCCVELPVELQNSNDIEQLKAATGSQVTCLIINSIICLHLRKWMILYTTNYCKNTIKCVVGRKSLI